MTTFFANLRKEEEAGKSFSVTHADKFQKSWFVYSGPYWGIWTYNARNHQLSWRAWDINHFDCTEYMKKAKKTVKVPLPTPIIECFNAKGWLKLMKSKHKLAAIQIANKHIKRYKMFMQTKVELTRKFDREYFGEESLNYFAHPEIESQILCMMNFAGVEETVKFIEENKKKCNDITIIDSLNKLGKDFRVKIWPALIKYGTAKKTLLAVKNRTPNAVINMVINNNNHYLNPTLIRLTDSIPDDTYNLTYNLKEEYKTRKEREYFTQVLKKWGKKGPTFIRDTRFQLRTVMQAELVGTLQDLVLYITNPIPISQLEEIHNRVSNYFRAHNEEITNALQERWSAETKKSREENLAKYTEMNAKFKFQDGISMLCTQNDFLKEGEIMHHCISSYYGANGFYFHFENGKEKATLQLSSKGLVQQFYGPCNKPVSSKLNLMLNDFLETNKGIFKEQE